MQLAGMSGNEFDGIFFTESIPPVGVENLKLISVQKNRQNSNLTEIKLMMANEAKSVGANAICSFKYGQKAHKWWEQAFTLKWDSEIWFGEGLAVRLDQK